MPNASHVGSIVSHITVEIGDFTSNRYACCSGGERSELFPATSVG